MNSVKRRYTYDDTSVSAASVVRVATILFTPTSDTPNADFSPLGLRMSVSFSYINGGASSRGTFELFLQLAPFSSTPFSYLINPIPPTSPPDNEFPISTTSGNMAYQDSQFPDDSNWFSFFKIVISGETADGVTTEVYVDVTTPNLTTDMQCETIAYLWQS